TCGPVPAGADSGNTYVSLWYPVRGPTTRLASPLISTARRRVVEAVSGDIARSFTRGRVEGLGGGGEPYSPTPVHRARSTIRGRCCSRRPRGRRNAHQYELPDPVVH